MGSIAFRIVLAGLAAFLVGVLAYNVVERTAVSSVKQRALDELVISRQALTSQMERFRRLPPVLGKDPRVLALIGQPSIPTIRNEANDYLRDVSNLSGAALIIVLNNEGTAIAASNLELIGENYQFRPYFQDARATGSGQFYAVGATTGVPGYFLSTRIETANGGQGIVVVKVDFASISQTWRQAAPGTALVDRYGIIFLTGDPARLYDSVRPLSQDVLDRIEQTRKYDNVDVASRKPLFSDAQMLALEADGDVRLDGDLVARLDVGENEWKLLRRVSLSDARNAALLGALLSMISALLIAGAGIIFWQRRNLIRMKLAQTTELETMVAERTNELALEIDERKRAEADLREAQSGLVQAAKLAALGRMATAIVHEVAQPLAAMETTLASASVYAGKGDQDKAGEAVGRARNTIQRMRRMVQHLKAFARRDQTIARAVDVNGVIRSAAALCEPRRKAADAEIELQLSDGVVAVRGGEVRLEQVFVNLIINALDAVGSCEQRKVFIASQKHDDHVVVVIEDSGVGVADDVLEKLGEPFFTTKATGEGLGLGLSISTQIVESFGGTLTIEPRDSGGTRVTVTLISEVLAEMPEAVMEPA